MQATAVPQMQIVENQSIVDEGMGTSRLVTKQDGTKVPFSDQILKEYLQARLEGLNQDYLQIDIILKKVSEGLYNGK